MHWEFTVMVGSSSNQLVFSVPGGDYLKCRAEVVRSVDSLFPGIPFRVVEAIKVRRSKSA